MRWFNAFGWEKNVKREYVESYNFQSDEKNTVQKHTLAKVIKASLCWGNILVVNRKRIRNEACSRVGRRILGIKCCSSDFSWQIMSNLWPRACTYRHLRKTTGPSINQKGEFQNLYTPPLLPPSLLLLATRTYSSLKLLNATFFIFPCGTYMIASWRCNNSRRSSQAVKRG